jgi:hypothetical protein
MNKINNIIKPILKRHLLIIGIGAALYFLISYFFGFLIGLIVNTVFLVCFILHIRIIEGQNLRTNPVNYRRAVNIGRLPADETARLKYICLYCGAQVWDRQCSKCGSKVRKPLF